jgi:hypothetical protein
MKENEKEEIKGRMREMFEKRADALAEEIARFNDRPGAVTFRDMEVNFNALLGRMGDDILGEVLQKKAASAPFSDKASEAFKKNTGFTTETEEHPSNCQTAKESKSAPSTCSLKERDGEERRKDGGKAARESSPS